MLDEVHKLLFDGLIHNFDTGNECKWITIKGDLGEYIGERAYVSVDDDGAGDFAIDEIVFAEARPPDDPPSTLLLSAIGIGATIGAASSLAAAYGRAWHETLTQWHAGTLDAAHAELLNWVLRNNLIDTQQVSPRS